MLIGVHGRLHSGKDTVYERMVEMGLKPVRFGFADKLKISAMASLGLRKDALGNDRSDQDLIDLANVMKERGRLIVQVSEGTHFEISGRQYLQFKGTEGGRDVFGQDFWVDGAVSDLDIGGSSLFVCTDVRFVNEAEKILSLGGEVWRVVGADEDTGTHLSEVPLPDHLITHTIDNSERGDSFASLDAQIKALIGAL